MFASEQITAAIVRLRDEYIASSKASNAYAINDGLCEDFAQEVIARLAGGETAELQMVWHDNYMVPGTYPDNLWDRALLESQMVMPPHGLTWDELDEVHYGGHAFIVHTTPSGVRFYDAECPEGTTNFFYLPLIRRCWEKKYGRLLV